MLAQIRNIILTKDLRIARQKCIDPSLRSG